VHLFDCAKCVNYASCNRFSMMFAMLEAMTLCCATKRRGHVEELSPTLYALYALFQIGANCARCNRCNGIHPCDTGDLKNTRVHLRGASRNSADINPQRGNLAMFIYSEFIILLYRWQFENDTKLYWYRTVARKSIIVHVFMISEFCSKNGNLENTLRIY